MTFEWDTEKSRSNLRKHGVSFQMASEVFLDENAFCLQDDRFDYSEPSVELAVLSGMVVFTERSGEVMRLISARKANRRERGWYCGQNS